MYNFSIEVSDNIAVKFDEKLKVSTELGINNIETSDVIDGVSVCDMSGEQLEKVRDALIDYGKRIVLMTYSGDISDKSRLNLLFRRALVLNVKGIKIVFKEGSDTSYANSLSKSYGIPILVENDSKSFVKDEKVMHELVKDNTQLSLIFNPFEFVCTQRHPFFHVYYTSKIKNNISFLRITDGLYTVHEPIMLHHGCAEVKELASIMLSRSYDGYFSFTPYLKNMTLDNYKECIAIFKEDLKRM